MTDQLEDVENRLRDAYAASETLSRLWDTELTTDQRTRVRRRRSWIGPALAAGAVVAIAVSVAVLNGGSPRHHTFATPRRPAASGGAPSSVSSPIVIDPSVSEVFAPSSANASSVAPQLSSDAAYQRYATLNGSTLTSPPQNVTVQLGYLTLPVGHGHAATASNELVWAYSYNDVCPALPNNPNVTSNSSVPCVSWLFLDAATGKEVDWTWRR